MGHTEKPLASDIAVFEDLMMRTRSYSTYVPDEIVLQLYPVDMETALPSVPEGYFWRVYEEYGRPRVGLFYRPATETKEVATFMTLFTGKTKTVQIKAKPRLVSQRAVNQKFTKDPVKVIFDAAMDVLSFLPGHLIEKVNPMDLKQYYGDYPPKNLLKVEDEVDK